MIKDIRVGMDAELKLTVIPVLRQKGFKGSFPHFRRLIQGKINLLTFQFDKNGGGFVVEIALCSESGFTTDWGEHIPASKVRAWDLHPNQRHRIQNKEGGNTDSWFRFDQGQYQNAAQQFLQLLPLADSWWYSEAQKRA